MKSCYLGDGRNPSSRKIVRLAKCNHKVTDLEKKRDYTSIKNARLEQELSSPKQTNTSSKKQIVCNRNY